jgi:hypothetical protein
MQPDDDRSPTGDDEPEEAVFELPTLPGDEIGPPSPVTRILRGAIALAVALALLVWGVLTARPDFLPAFAQPIPLRALGALDRLTAAPGLVLHVTSVAQQSYGPLAGARRQEEVWLDRASNGGRSVTIVSRNGSPVSTETIVCDLTGALVVTEIPGRRPQTQRFQGANGWWRAELDKLGLYRRMLQSPDTKDAGDGLAGGAPTHKLRTAVADFPAGGYETLMFADILQADYLPVSFGYSVTRVSDGSAMGTFERVFKSFEVAPRAELRADYFSPNTTDAPANIQRL